MIADLLIIADGIYFNEITIRYVSLDTGKSVVCIQKAINTSEEDLEVDTYFTSMVATDKFGAPAQHSYLFDLTTKRKLKQNPRLKFITTSDLLAFYYSRQTKAKRSIMESESKMYYAAYERKLSARDRFDEMGIDKLWRRLLENQIGVYSLLTFFVKHHRSSNFIIDEMPLLPDGYDGASK